MVRDTQLESWAICQETLAEKLFDVFQAVCRAENGVTNREIADALGWDFHCVTGKVKNLYDQGLIDDSTQRRPCRKSGKNQIVWKWTGRVDPLPIPKAGDSRRVKNARLEELKWCFDAIRCNFKPEMLPILEMIQTRVGEIDG